MEPINHHINEFKALAPAPPCTSASCVSHILTSSLPSEELGLGAGGLVSALSSWSRWRRASSYLSTLAWKSFSTSFHRKCFYKLQIPGQSGLSLKCTGLMS